VLFELHSDSLAKDVSVLVSTYKDLHDILSNEKSDILNRLQSLQSLSFGLNDQTG